MAIQKISQLTSLPSNEVTASIDLLAIVDTTNSETKNITVNSLLTGISASGSFSGSFQGDGTNITGVTGEWDGSHLGDASITGSLTIEDPTQLANPVLIVKNTSLTPLMLGRLSQFGTTAESDKIVFTNGGNIRTVGNIEADGDISASADVYGVTGSFLHLLCDGDISSSADVYGITGSFLHLEGDGSQLTGVTSEWDGTLNGNAEITGSLIVTGDITGSNISASGNVLGNRLVASGQVTTSTILSLTDTVLINDNLNVNGNITSSGMFRGEQLYINSGSQTVLPTPATGDVAVLSMSSSGAFSTTAAITPNNLVLFSEYNTSDPSIIDGKAATSILLTTNHSSNGNNSVAQIACVAQEEGSNYADLVFSTRGLGNNITERMRITQNATSITGSLDVSSVYKSNGVAGIAGTFTFGGGGSGDIASMTFTGGILTGTTVVP